jgi:transcriptional regulator with XRE-family HTH domain
MLGMRTARERRGITQKELGRITGIHEITLSRWENGHQSPSIKGAELVARALGVPLSELLDGSRSKHNTSEAARVIAREEKSKTPPAAISTARDRKASGASLEGV